jgi:hypothetical protein
MAKKKCSAAINPYSIKRSAGRLWAVVSASSVTCTRAVFASNRAANPTATAPTSMRPHVFMTGEIGSAHVISTGLVENRAAASATYTRPRRSSGFIYTSPGSISSDHSL